MKSKIDKIKSALKKNLYERSTYLLTLVDTSPSSKTYGCFDRQFWQYKIKDFPSGMSQEAVFAISLALQNNIYGKLSNKSKNTLLNITFVWQTLGSRFQEKLIQYHIIGKWWSREKHGLSNEFYTLE